MAEENRWKIWKLEPEMGQILFKGIFENFLLFLNANNGRFNLNKSQFFA